MLNFPLQHFSRPHGLLEQMKSYHEILGQWDILLHNFTSIGFKNLFRCLIFFCYKISICKKEKLKDETSKKIRETNDSQ